MVRSTAISWTIGLAITASAIPLSHLPALADDKPAPEEVETRTAPIETKSVPVTLTPPTSDSESASWRQLRKDGPATAKPAKPGPSKQISIWEQPVVGTAAFGQSPQQPAPDAPIVTVRPAPAAPTTPPSPPQAKPASGTTAAVQPRAEDVQATPNIVTVRPAPPTATAQPAPQQPDPPPVWERPTDNAALSQPRPEQPEAAPTVQASRKGGLLVPRPPEVDPAPVAVQPAEQAAFVQPGPEPVEPAPTAAQAGLKPAILQPKPEQAEAAPPAAQSGWKASTAQSRPQPEKIQEAVARVEKPLAPEPRPRVAALPANGNANPPLAAPSLPGRSPFRQSAFKSEVVDNPAAFQQPEKPKGNAAQRFLNNLNPWSKKETGTPVASNTQPSPPPAGEAGQTDAPKTPVKRFIDGIQFWKK